MPTPLNIFLRNHILKTKLLICQILDFYISFICYADVDSMKLKEENDQLVVIRRVDLAELIKTLRNKVGNAYKITLEQKNKLPYPYFVCLLWDWSVLSKIKKDWFVGAKFFFFLIYFPVQRNMILVFVGGFSVIIQKLG